MSIGYYDESYPPSLWTTPPETGERGSASDDDAFFEPTVTAQDSINAAKLTGLGYVANPLTAWPTGDAIYVNSNFRFHWTGTAWAPGLAVVIDDPEPESETQSDTETYAATPVAPEDMPEVSEE